MNIPLWLIVLALLLTHAGAAAIGGFFLLWLFTKIMVNADTISTEHKLGIRYPGTKED